LRQREQAEQVGIHAGTVAVPGAGSARLVRGAIEI
jgi:hypothetical protein